MTQVKKPVLKVPAWTRRTFTGVVAGGDSALPAKDRQRLDRPSLLGRVTVRELREGLEIETNSYVGVLPLTEFTLHITPRIGPHDLMQMVDYCFDVGKVHMSADMGAVHADTSLATTDLLVLAFLSEVQCLLTAGLFREYVEQAHDLQTVRGRIQFSELASRPRLGMTLPCRYEDLSGDTFLNQLLLAAVRIAADCASSFRLKRYARRIEEQMSQVCSPISVTGSSFATAISGLTRLNRRYHKALELGWLLYDSVIPDQSGSKVRSFTGFLIDMNRLYERFAGRLLEEFCPPGMTVVFQRSIKSLFRTRERQYKYGRPDFMLMDSECRCVCVVDAKYKFLDECYVDSGDLYQLTVYGLATGSRKAIALYPGRSGHSRQFDFQGLDVKSTVVFRSLDMAKVWQVLSSEDRVAEGQRMVAELLA